MQRIRTKLSIVFFMMAMAAWMASPITVYASDSKDKEGEHQEEGEHDKKGEHHEGGHESGGDAPHEAPSVLAEILTQDLIIQAVR